MSSRRMKVSKCPSDTLTMTNRAIVNARDFDKQVNNASGDFMIDESMQDGKVPLISELSPH